MSGVVRGRQRADGEFEEQQRMVGKGVFRVHAAKPNPRLPADIDALPNDLTFDPKTITCIHCGRPPDRWDEPCGDSVAMIVRPA